MMASKKDCGSADGSPGSSSSWRCRLRGLGGRGGDAGAPAPDRRRRWRTTGSFGPQNPALRPPVSGSPGRGGFPTPWSYRLSERGADELYLRRFAGCPEDD